MCTKPGKLLYVENKAGQMTNVEVGRGRTGKRRYKPCLEGKNTKREARQLKC